VRTLRGTTLIRDDAVAASAPEPVVLGGDDASPVAIAVHTAARPASAPRSAKVPVTPSATPASVSRQAGTSAEPSLRLRAGRSAAARAFAPRGATG
jgi:hypothetical protein